MKPSRALQKAGRQRLGSPGSFRFWEHCNERAGDIVSDSSSRVSRPLLFHSPPPAISPVCARPPVSGPVPRTTATSFRGTAFFPYGAVADAAPRSPRLRCRHRDGASEARGRRTQNSEQVGPNQTAEPPPPSLSGGKHKHGNKRTCSVGGLRPQAGQCFIGS